MSTNYAPPNYPSPKHGAGKNGVKQALILMGVMVAIAAALVLAYVGIRLLSSVSFASMVPHSHSVDAENFELRYGPWGTIRDFTYRQVDPKMNQWEFTGSLELSKDAQLHDLIWYIEIYQDSKLLNVITEGLSIRSGDQLTASEASQMDAANRKGNHLSFLKANHNFYYGDRQKPFKFLSYVARKGSSATPVPISSVVASSTTGSKSPIAYERKLDMKKQVVKFSDGFIEIDRYGRDRYDEDQIKFKMDVLDQEFLDQFDISDVQRNDRLYFVVENKYGSLLRFGAVDPARSFQRHADEMSLPSPRMTFNSWEQRWYRSGPFKVYLARMKERGSRRLSRQVGIGETIQVYSNILEVERISKPDRD